MNNLEELLQVLGLKATITYNPNDHLFYCHLADGTNVSSSTLGGVFYTLKSVYKDFLGGVFDEEELSQKDNYSC